MHSPEPHDHHRHRGIAGFSFPMWGARVRSGRGALILLILIGISLAGLDTNTTLYVLHDHVSCLGLSVLVPKRSTYKALAKATTEIIWVRRMS